ncbi:SRPBCC family protein [Isoptericola sp. AK164]|uniref:SRPBCC family protein n=1 Tax=Isoptericola sp. AK164 TaxID=3024246 RepID=UPI002418AD40|nr:SRPBCC family protein [Isoptericola sp. AK164]
MSDAPDGTTASRTRRRAAVAVLAAPAVAGLTAAAGVVATGAHRRLGTTEAETRVWLPGDELLEGGVVQADRACTIAAPPPDVWPWIAQLGQDKAGFYSFEALENLVGCRITGATTIHPEWQDVQVGDAFRLHPDLALRVAEVVPGSHLVVTSQRADGAPEGHDFTWAFHLESVSVGPAPATRLHLRERYESKRPVDRAVSEALSLVSAAMSRRMMRRLAELAAAPPART